MTRMLTTLLLVVPTLTTASPPPQPVVTLLDAGAEPHRQLRYQIPEGQKEALQLTIGLSTAQNVDGEKTRTQLPDVHFEASVQVGKAPTTGGTHAELSLDTIRVLEGEKGVQQGTLGTLRRAWKGVVGAKVQMQLSNRGIPARIAMKLGHPVPDAITEPMQGVLEALRQLQIPLPEEAVGPGARWTLKREMKTGGIAVERVTTYRLTEATGSRIRVELSESASTTQTAFPMEGLPKGMTVRLERVGATGAGSAVSDLRQVVPSSSKRKSTLTMTLGGRAGTRVFGLTTAVETGTRVEGKKTK